MLVALTGNSGSGASTVAGFWEERGCRVCSLDRTGHRLMEKPRIRAALKVPGLDRVSGPQARRILRERAFTEPGLLDDINRVMHPVMIRWVAFCAERCRGLPGVWVLEGALVFELGLEKYFDTVVAVVDTPERAVLRIIQRDGVSRRVATARRRRQLPPEIKAGKADLVIRNSGTLEDLERSSCSVLDRLIQIGGKRGQQNP